MRLLVLGLILVACGSGKTPAPRTAPAADAATPTLAGAVRLVAVQGRDASIRVENGSASVARLHRALRVERSEPDGWHAVDEVGDIWLRDGCAPRDGVIFWQNGATECVEVAAGATMIAPAWMATIGDAQCACERCVAAPAGRYRLAATTCDGVIVEGEPFDLGASP